MTQNSHHFAIPFVSGQRPPKVFAHRFWWARFLVLFIAATALVTGGCLSRPHLRTQSFSFAVLPQSSPAPHSQRGTLSVRRLSVAASFADQSFVYRTGALSYERDPYAGFLVPPEENLAEPLRTYFRQSGAFQRVVEPGSAIQPDTLVEVSVEQLYGDFRPGTPPAAVLNIRFTFFSANHGITEGVVLDNEYARRIPLKNRTAAAVMGGWNTALAEIFNELDHDLNVRNDRQRAQASVRK